MELGISTASLFTRCQTEEAPQVIRSMGAGLAELFLNSFCEYKRDYITLLAKRVRDAGIRVYSVHPMSAQFEAQLFSIHDRQRADAAEIYSTVLEAGARLGAQVYVMHGSPHLNGAAKNLQTERLVPIFAELNERARSFGLTLALENVSWCFFNKPSFGAALRDALGGEGKMKFVLDSKQAGRSGYSPIDFVNAVGSDVVNWHICDYRGKGSDFRPVLPPNGEADIAGTARALLDAGYQGSAILELYSDMYAGLDELAVCYRNVLDLLTSQSGGTMV